MCDNFHLPIVNFVDQPGFMIGPDAERAGTIRYGMAAVAAAVRATIPWASIQVHKGFGVATAAHYGRQRLRVVLAIGGVGRVPLEGGVAVAYHRQIAAAENPEAKRRELEDQLRAARSPFARAESFAVHEMIDPRETRPMLCRWIELIQPQLETLLGPVKFGLRP